MRFPPSLLDEIRARLPVSQVVSRKVSLKRAGREFKGLSPFKTEKTPSFTVNDQKGFYHCFASGEHGDIFKFVMATEGLSFPEAVERLAEEAGLPLPKAGPRDAEIEDERSRLYALIEASARFFEAQLTASVGLDARRYLERRGLNTDTSMRFRLGYAPNSRSALKDHLAKAGFTHAEMVASGMLVTGDDIPVAYDRFRNRVIFPITDLRGRTIAFGGRALDPDAPAKYLNSPETPLFHKGAVLFNAHRARGAAHDSGQIIAVEGYMDVIALSEAGFANTVAPLGTALTEDQVALLWRLAPVPTLCFDGDPAGRRAAFRAVETVLPHLKPGFSVQFAFLPDGLDPDDLVRQQGPAALQAILARAAPLFDVLIEREERQGEPAITPEQRAALDARLQALVARIADRGVRDQYQRELRKVLWVKSDNAMRAIARADGRRGYELARQRRNNTEPDWRIGARAQGAPRRLPRGTNPATLAVRGNELAERAPAIPPREALILLTALNHPWLLEARCEQLAELSFASKPLATLRAALLELLARNIALDSAQMRSQLTLMGLEGVVAQAERAITHKGDRFVALDADPVDVEAGWQHAVELQAAHVGFKRSLEAASQSLPGNPSDDELADIVELARRLEPESSNGSGL